MADKNTKLDIQLKEIDYKNIKLLKKFTTVRHKIKPRKYTGLSAKAQRKLSKEIKKAREMGLMKYTDRH